MLTRTDTLCMYACIAIYLAVGITQRACGLTAITLSKPNPAWLNRLTRR